ncbi:MAG: ABC transporter ATP-binding protein [Burkholderiaceae bacterium]
MSSDTRLVVVEAVELRTPARTLVSGLSFEIHRGERWAVLGPNGAGKSTLLAALAGARIVDQGGIRVGNSAIGSLAEHELARERAFVGDRWSDAFSSLVLDTVLTARYVFRDEDSQAGHALELLSALDCADLAQRDVRRLSRGERQRVALATALAQDTPIVLLDEPTAHQDPRHQALVVRRLVELSDRGCVASLHDLNAAARFATHALLLFGDGRFRAGPAAELLAPGPLSELFATPISVVEAEGEMFFHVHHHAVGSPASARR